MSKTYKVAVVGATGAVGEAMMTLLAERNFPLDTLYPLASTRSVGESIQFKGQSLDILDTADFDFSRVDIALFSAGSEVSAQYAPVAASQGAVVIDNTSHFRMDNAVPLVVPEVNPEAIDDYQAKNIIANPNCSTIQMVVALKPIVDAVGIERINVATYQAVSGSGKGAIAELTTQCGEMLNGRPPEASVYSQPIAFNVLPQIDVFEDNGYTKEEMKMVNETKKIFADSAILVNPTAVRVPVMYGHAEALHIETKQAITAADARALLEKAAGVKVIDSIAAGDYPTPLTHAAGSDSVYVGRIRQDLSHPRGLNMWVVSDNVRKGAALNAIQIAELLIARAAS